MKRWVIVISCALIYVLQGQQVEFDEVQLDEVVLPFWEDDELEALESGELVPGSSLLGKIALKFYESDNVDPIALDPAVRDLPDEEPEPVSWPTRIEERFFAAYFQEMPRGFLNDPQHLLTSQEFRDREAFLNYHARDTDIDLYIYLFDALQEIPPTESIGSVVRSHIDQNKAVAVVFYFLGMPEKSQVAFSEAVTETVSPDEQEKVLRMAVEEALEKSDPTSQLESFSIQLSIRLYWLEKVVARGAGTAATSRPLILPRAKFGSHVKKGALEKLKEKPAIFYSVMIVVVALVSVSFGWMGRWIADRKRVYIFPDAEGTAILDAPHAPGVGGMISFSSVMDSPSSQKNDVPDYLQRM
ncbi:hypothetical protein N9891_01255 [bacterium]|nr:hypothetical protein [bacterium]